MNFKKWLEGITSFDSVQMKPSNLNADFERSDIKSKYVASSTTPTKEPKRHPEEQFGFGKRDIKSMPKCIDTGRKIVPMRTTQIYT